MLRNEEMQVYTANDTTAAPAQRITSARVKLAGVTEPSVTIANRNDLEKYCRNLLDGCAYEEFHIVCVDVRCRVLSDSCIAMGTLDSVNTYIRNIATIALLSNAKCIFLTHNHPGGTCAPSMEDISSTLQIERALKMFDIQVLDHMIITATGAYSMKQHGDY